MLVNIISIILSTLLSGLSIFVAVRAYKQGTKQIEISNKQSLFKERTNAYIQLNNLFYLYENNKFFLNKSEDMPELSLSLLTSNKMLERIVRTDYNPIENEEDNKFPIKMEELRAFSLQIALLWEGAESTIASCFILEYIQVLCSLHSRLVYLSAEKKYKQKELTESKQKFLEAFKQSSLKKDIAELNRLYFEMKEKKVLEVLKEQIRLK